MVYASTTTPIYQSTASVQATNVLLIPGTGLAGNLSMQTEQEAVTSDPVAKCAALLLRDETFRADPPEATIDTDVLCSADALAGTKSKGLESHVSVTVPPQSDVLAISYRSPSGRDAQAGAEAFAVAYIHSKIARAQLLLVQLRAPLLTTQESMNKSLTKLNTKLEDAIVANSGEKATAAGNQEVQNLTSQRNAVQQQLDNITLQLLNLDPSHLNPPQLLVPAKLPTRPVIPNKVLNGILGLFVGLVFGVGFAFIRERLDDRLRGRSDLEEQARAPVLAVVPMVPGWRHEGESHLVISEQPRSPSAEAYRKLRTSILFATAQHSLKSLMVCSATAGEGKTSTAANLAVALAESGKRVILLSADLRRPRVHKFFGLKNEAGLTEMLLLDHAYLADYLLDPHFPNLRVLPSGASFAQPAELLQAAKMEWLMKRLTEIADFVVVDTAPLLLVSDALSVARIVDGAVMVADAAKTSRWAVRDAREQLDEAGVPIIGSVLNKFDPAKSKSHPYYYGYYYGAYSYGGYPQELNGPATHGDREPVPDAGDAEEIPESVSPPNHPPVP
jgi:capsular exopolysaccharide synthesis family protein